MNAHRCAHCGKTFTPVRSTARYCGDACRQAAYRRRDDSQVGSEAREAQRVASAIATKRDTVLTRACATCGRQIQADALTMANRLYCSNACKQAAWRARHKA